MWYTTLHKILEYNPCGQEPDVESGKLSGWLKLLAYLGKTEVDDEPLSIETILVSNGLIDALWSLQAVDGHKREERLLACDYAEHVAHLFNKKYPDDSRVSNCIAVARRYANGDATEEDLNTAWAGAKAAVGDAERAGAEVPEAAARASLRAASGNAEYAAVASSVAAEDAADAEKQWQTERLLEVITETERGEGTNE